ncbi:hypothetical protein MUO66_07455 [Candidatus Bathyarchaeota archaeon]|nr:hypothetical protein [Candidatus Bathyarchaeota archaeon]
MMFIYCNTKDSPKLVGETICRANFIVGGEHSWRVKEEGDFCTIEINSKFSCVAIVYSVGDSVVGVEIDDDCGSKVIEPLIEIYGFEKVKWLTTQ